MNMYKKRLQNVCLFVNTNPVFSSSTVSKINPNNQSLHYKKCSGTEKLKKLNYKRVDNFSANDAFQSGLFFDFLLKFSIQ